MERFPLRMLPFGIAGLLVAIAIAVFGTGCGSGEDVAKGDSTSTKTATSLERVELDALQTYQWYLEGETFQLLKVTERLKKELARGNESEAKFLYGRSRVLFGHIAPAVQLFPSLDTSIDGFQEEFSNGEFTGFHKIEQVLYEQRSTKGLNQVTSQLIADLQRLQKTFEEAEFEPQPVAESAADVMQEVSERWPAGKMQPYAHYDLVDISARVEGAQRAYEAVRPLLLISSLDLAADVELKFVYAYEMLAGRGSPARQVPIPELNAGALFIPYGDMNPQDIKQISEPLDELAEVLAEVPLNLAA